MKTTEMTSMIVARAEPNPIRLASPDDVRGDQG